VTGEQTASDRPEHPVEIDSIASVALNRRSSPGRLITPLPAREPLGVSE